MLRETVIPDLRLFHILLDYFFVDLIFSTNAFLFCATLYLLFFIFIRIIVKHGNIYKNV